MRKSKLRGFVFQLGGLLFMAVASYAQRLPNDPFFAEQATWHQGGTYRVLRSSTRATRKEVSIDSTVGLDLPDAWAVSTGSRDVIVAVLDDGFFYGHEDVAPNVWHNPGESGLDANGVPKECNGLDDDGNGYIDDVVGWDFVFDDPDPDPYVFDGMDRARIQPYWHSISALGIIGAKGNNGIGVAGINWDVSLMLLKIGAQGATRGVPDSLRIGRAARAIRYAADNGARIINWSGFVDDHSAERLEILRDAIRYAASRNVLLVLCAGNDRRDLDLDSNCLYPQCFNEPNLLCVGQVALDGSLYQFEVGGQKRGSNYGAHRVELAAPGENFATSLRNAQSTYELTNGTSNAGPVVAGVAALVLSIRPDLTAVKLKELLIDSGTPDKALIGLVASGRVINPLRALQYAKNIRR